MSQHERPNLVSFNDIDYSDPKQMREAQQSMLREQAVRQQGLVVLRQALEKCFETQGQNQFENCKDLAERYLDLLPKSEMRGFLAHQRNDFSK